MSDQDVPTQAGTPQLNPFAFPSDTDFRFLLLVVSVLGASLFIYSAVYFSIPATKEYWREIQLRCLEIRPEMPTDLSGFRNPEYVAAQVAFEQCRAPAERANAIWIVGGVCLLLMVSGVIYWTSPARQIRRDKLVPLSAEDAPDVLDYLTKLSRTLKFSPLPIFLWNPLNPARGGLAFGRRGKYYVSFTGGLVTQFYTDLPAFRAVVLHELAHLRNADVDKAYFAVAVWQAFLVAALLPLLVTLVGNGWGYVLSIVWRVAALAALVYLMRNAVLRTREMYADVRASIWDGSTDALARVLDSLSRSKNRIWLPLQLHPDPASRRQVLKNPNRLFPMSFWDAFATGIAAAIALPNMIPLLTSFLTGTGSSGLESLGSVMLVTPFVVGVVGLGAWRTTFAALAQGESPHGVGRLGLGLGLGILLGVSFSFTEALVMSTTEILSWAEMLFNLVWALVLLVSLFFFLRWIAVSSSAWLEVAMTYSSPRYVYTLGLVVAGLILAIWLGLLFYLRNLGVIAFLVLLSPFDALASITQNPLTLLLLVSFWAFPLAAWFSRRRIASYPRASWAFLSAESQGSILIRQTPLRPALAVMLGVIAGLAFLGLLLLLRVLIRMSLSEAARNTDDFLWSFFLAQIGIAVFLQIAVGVVVAAWVPRLGAFHGLLAAFVSGCLMASGILGVNLIFGGTFSPMFVWTTFSQVVNDGALLALPAVWAVSWLAELTRYRRNQPSLLSQGQIA